MAEAGKTSPLDVKTRAVATARRAGLNYSCDRRPGIHRRRAGKGFIYVTASNRRVRNAATLARIAALVIPPAWNDVWICPSPRGHLQATGMDDRGRKQYKYHARWRDVRDERKFQHLLAIGQALPKIRRAIGRDLALPGLPQRKVLAAVVRLLDKTFLRVGNEAYAAGNGHFGLTTVRNRHAHVHGANIEFAFVGKSGKQRDIDLTDPRLARVVRACQHLPGQHLFEYRREGGGVGRITSTHVNAYLKEISGLEISAKDFRTWAGTVLAVQALADAPPAESQRQRAKQMVAVVREVAGRLGNTMAVCRKCYIHPGALEHYLAGSLTSCCESTAGAHPRGVSAAEATALCFLRKIERRTAG